MCESYLWLNHNSSLFPEYHTREDDKRFSHLNLCEAPKWRKKCKHFCVNMNKSKRSLSQGNISERRPKMRRYGEETLRQGWWRKITLSLRDNKWFEKQCKVRLQQPEVQSPQSRLTSNLKQVSLLSISISLCNITSYCRLRLQFQPQNEKQIMPLHSDSSARTTCLTDM